MGLRKKWVDIYYYKVVLTSRPVAIFYYLILMGLLTVASLWLDHFLKFPKLLCSLFGSILLSLPLLSIGLFLILWSSLHFVKVHGTFVPFKPPSKLVTVGPYAYVRNPMLTGVFILMFGLGFLFKSISLVFIFTPIFILLNLLELKAIEEAELEARYGKEYTDYKKKVPMFIPWQKLKIRNNNPDIP